MKTVLFALFLGFLPRAMIAGETDSSELIGTSWKLVKIAYGDDTIYNPDDQRSILSRFRTRRRSLRGSTAIAATEHGNRPRRASWSLGR